MWINERAIPLELLRLVNEPDTPNELKVLITKAQEEIENDGAVKYPTKSNIEFLLDKYKRQTW